jgi:hypothetical protein
MNFFNKLYTFLCFTRAIYLKSIDFLKNLIFNFFDYVYISWFRLDEYLLSNVLFFDLYYSNNKNWKSKSLYLFWFLE